MRPWLKISSRALRAREIVLRVLSTTGLVFKTPGKAPPADIRAFGNPFQQVYMADELKRRKHTSRADMYMHVVVRCAMRDGESWRAWCDWGAMRLGRTRLYVTHMQGLSMQD